MNLLKLKCTKFAKMVAVSEILKYTRFKTDQEIIDEFKKPENDGDSAFMKWSKNKSDWAAKYIEKMQSSMKLEETS